MSENVRVKNEILSLIQRKMTAFFATVEGDQPRVRVIELVPFENRLYFATGSDNLKVNQIQSNPKSEFCLLIERECKNGSLRVECIAMIVEDLNLKKIMYDYVEEWKEFYEGSKDPRFTLVELKPTLYIYNKPGTSIIKHLEY